MRANSTAVPKLYLFNSFLPSTSVNKRFSQLHTHVHTLHSSMYNSFCRGILGFVTLLPQPRHTSHSHTSHIYEDQTRWPRPHLEMTTRETRDSWAGQVTGLPIPRSRVFGEDCTVHSSKHSLAKLMVSITGNADITVSAHTPALIRTQKTQRRAAGDDVCGRIRPQ